MIKISWVQEIKYSWITALLKWKDIPWKENKNKKIVNNNLTQAQATLAMAKIPIVHTALEMSEQ